MVKLAGSSLVCMAIKCLLVQPAQILGLRPEREAMKSRHVARYSIRQPVVVHMFHGLSLIAPWQACTSMAAWAAARALSWTCSMPMQRSSAWCLSCAGCTSMPPCLR